MMMLKSLMVADVPVVIIADDVDGILFYAYKRQTKFDV